MFRCPPRISAGTLLILLPALALGTALLSACGAGAKQVSIRFGVENTAADSAVVHTVQFYVHAIELLDEHGKPHAVRFTADLPWQTLRRRGVWRSTEQWWAERARTRAFG
jgi:hypothetical protein